MIQISTAAAIGFIITTILTVFFLYKAIKSIKILIVISLWMIITAMLAFKGFYSNTKAPLHFIFLITPGVLFVLITGLGKTLSKDKHISLLKRLTILHIIRIPVELLLFCIYKNGLIPHLMTFEGYNFDIFSGITAPFLYYFVFLKKTLDYKFLLGWNIICLILLINIVTIAVLSAPTPFQKLAFNQPNIGVTYFPYAWLPTVIVPVVLYSHIICIRQLFTSIKLK